MNTHYLGALLCSGALIASGLTGCTASASLLDQQRGSGISLSIPSPRPTPTARRAGVPAPTRSTGQREQGTATTTQAMIGLYGELLNETGRAGLPFDGSSNVAQVTFATEGACSNPDVDPSGKWLAFASTQHSLKSDIYVKPINGRTMTQITSDPSDDIMPAWHPSGQSVAFASNRGENWDIYVTSISGGHPMRITDDSEPELHPSWAPDGKHLIYCKLGAMSGRWEIWVVDIDNPGVRRFLDYGLFPKWCPDPARPKILLQRARQRGSRFFSIWTVDFVNGDVVHPTEIVSANNAAVINPAWAPDGRHIVFVTVVEPDQQSDTALEQADIWIVDLEGAGRVNLTNGRFANYQPVWGSDDRVYFVSDRTNVDNVWAVTTRRALPDTSINGPIDMTNVLEDSRVGPYDMKP